MLSEARGTEAVGKSSVFGWHAVAQLVEALRYKPVRFPMVSLEFFIDINLSNRNEYHEYFLGDKGGRCVGLTTLPPSCAVCLEIWEP
jgi:hypothetical protein